MADNIDIPGYEGQTEEERKKLLERMRDAGPPAAPNYYPEDDRAVPPVLLGKDDSDSRKGVGSQLDDLSEDERSSRDFWADAAERDESAAPRPPHSTEIGTARPEADVPPTPPTPGSVATSLGQVISTSIRKSEPTGGRAVPISPKPSDKEVQGYLEKIRTAKRELAGHADTSFLDRAEKEAKELYTDRADRAEWLSVAERVGNALVRLGAAQSGLRNGVDASHVDLGPGIDWEKKISRYGDDYKTEAGRLDKVRGQLRDSDALAQKDADNQFEDKRTADKAGLSWAEKKYTEEMDTHQADKRDSNAAIRAENSAISSDARKEVSDLARERRLQNDNTQKEINSRIELMKGDLKLANEASIAANEAAGILKAEGDYSSKALSKMEPRKQAVLAKAGITPDVLDQIEKDSVIERFGPDGVDEEKKARLVKELLASKKQEVTNIKASLDKLNASRSALSQGGQTAPAAPAPLKEPTPALVKQYTGLHPQVTEQQAYDILKQRLNK